MTHESGIGRESFMVFEPPSSRSIEIELDVRLESWMAADHRDQLRLRQYLDWLEPRVGSLLRPIGNALELSVAVPPERSLAAGGGDLDNYLLPIVRRLGHQRFVSVWGSKRRAARSTIAIAPAATAALPDWSWRFACAVTSRAKDTSAWKQDIDAQLRTQVTSAATSAVEMQIAFDVEPNWNWSGCGNLRLTPSARSLAKVDGRSIR